MRNNNIISDMHEKMSKIPVNPLHNTIHVQVSRLMRFRQLYVDITSCLNWFFIG